MLLLAKHMHGASVEASDGKIGKLCDLLFDEQDWTIRYLVLDGGTWLNRRRSHSPARPRSEKRLGRSPALGGRIDKETGHRESQR